MSNEHEYSSLEKINQKWEWKEDNWSNYYFLAKDIIDASVFFKTEIYSGV